MTVPRYNAMGTHMTSSTSCLDTSTLVTTHTKSNRSPPIYIKNLTILSKLRNALSPILGPEGFSFKSSKDFIIIKTADCANHLKAVEYIAKTDLSFHTFPPHCNRPIQAVIRHLHHSIHVDDIVTALTELGFSVLSVHDGVRFLEGVTLLLFMQPDGVTNIVIVVARRWLYMAIYLQDIA
ncbi:hypothetical protein QTP88_005694 [Uroleucon formosanum]